MLAKRQRLTRAAFTVAFKRGKRSHTPLVQVIHDPTEPDFHGAVVVGKKVAKRAVARNRLRRQLYGVLYRYHKMHDLRGTYIVVLKPAAAQATTAERAAALTTLLDRHTP